MVKIKFNVSSKTARLIGRENISDSNGALVELVKNAYDADAENTYIQFNIKYEDVPIKTTIQQLKEDFSDEELQIIQSMYEVDDKKLTKKKDLSEEENEKLKTIFFSKNQIILVDNGTGMSEEIVKTVWMNIGTDDKEINVYSRKGRIKTGAKGIGRFALEKLSLRTTVYTQKQKESLIYWNMDWSQFESRSLLNDINADVEIRTEEFNEVLKEILKEDYKNIKNSNWNNGTIIILEGTREPWSEKIFSRINRNLNSINPFGHTDKFDIIVNNKIRPNLNFKTHNIYMSKEHYDYRILAEYDGKENIKIELERNEIDINATEQKEIIEGKEYVFDINEFWKREAVNKKNYRRKDYDKTIKYNVNVKNIIKGQNDEELEKVGRFSLDLYFLKSGKSDFSIVKAIKVNTRKELLKNFSGVKLYRDSFKVRPYGEEGPMYDWLELGRRAQASPAGIAHPIGHWKVEPYQLIGNINISRLENKNLTDMANRESLVLNNTYYVFVEIIQAIISKFENDRQYIYREYGAWLKNKIREVSKSEEIVNAVVNEKENKNNENDNDEGYTEEEYKEAIYDVVQKHQSELDTKRILMNFSSAGIIASTFSHEISKVATNLGSRNQQLRACIDYILNYKEFAGDQAFNPYTLLDKYCSTDELLSTWVRLIMEGVSKNSFEQEEINLAEFMNEFSDKWKQLLKQKYIEVELIDLENVKLKIAKIDLYLIFNNLFLNSAWFLEKKEQGTRKIIITAQENEQNLKIIFKNNGPTLNKQYNDNPDKIFEAGETSKEDGTGLGLWICKEAINRNNGEINANPIEEGFEIIMNFIIGD